VENILESGKFKRLSFQGGGRGSVPVWMEVYRNETFKETVNASDPQMGLFLGLQISQMDVQGCHYI